MIRTKADSVAEFRGMYPDCDVTLAGVLFDETHVHLCTILPICMQAVDVYLNPDTAPVVNPGPYSTANKLILNRKIDGSNNYDMFHRPSGNFLYKWVYDVDYSLGRIWTVEYWYYETVASVTVQKMVHLKPATLADFDKHHPGWRQDIISPPVVSPGYDETLDPQFYTSFIDEFGYPAFHFYPRPKRLTKKGINNGGGTYPDTAEDDAATTYKDNNFIRIRFSNALPITNIPRGMVTDKPYVYGMAYRYAMKKDAAKSALYYARYMQEIKIAENLLNGRSMEQGDLYMQPDPRRPLL